MVANTQKFLIFREYKKFCEENGYPPTQNQLGDKFGKSRTWVWENTKDWLNKCDGLPFIPQWRRNFDPSYFKNQIEEIEEPVDEFIKKGILPSERTYYNSK